ncbi:MAG TPA: tryptophan synthase subunit alpha [Polyangiaceae bacterium]|nr:tryptophan synthase subunit alpha [Polyangiaceae bacterium]
MSRIERTFEQNRAAGRTSLVAYVTVGFRNLDESYEAARAALEAGADMLELGVPFSDPSADGPVIAKASYEAIGQGGSLKSALQLAKKLREHSDAPLVLFTYYNPIVWFGDVALVEAAAAAGVDALLVVDLPPDEGAELRQAAAERGVAIVPLIAPTSGPEREKAILSSASGFVYYVSVAGVTGTGVAPLAEAGRHAAELSTRFGLPVVVGFGVDSPEKAKLAASSGAPGVVVGTALIRALGGAAPGQGAAAVRELVGRLRAGLDG